MNNEVFTSNILNSISDGVFTVNTDWEITSFNRAAEIITGIKIKDALGQKCFEVFKSNMCEKDCPLKKTMKTGKPLINKSGYCISKNGTRIPISVSTAILKDENGTILGGAETFRDLSEIEKLKNDLLSRGPHPVYESKSPSMQSILSILTSVSESSSSVLIQGETGTGKEVLARTIHTQSPRKNKPFIAVNCGALPESLLESELFGYTKGAFTGADKDKPGRFALAEGGTLFLDEIGDISSAMQVKLLRVLQEREYEPLGGIKPVKTDVRILCATNKDLPELIKNNTFRQDLYYRINVITIMLPGLKDRKEDIADIAQSFLEIYSTRMNKSISGFDSEVFKFFYEYSWPGNIRELENIVERMTVLAKESILTIDLIPSTLLEHNEKKLKPEEKTVEQAREKAERECIMKALKANSWNKAKTAADLNIDKATLWRKIKKLKIEEH